MKKSALHILFLLLNVCLFAQPGIFKEADKYGIRENDQVIIQPIHDTIFNFDSTGKVCLACAKIRGVHPNKYIRTPVFSFNCSYMNKKGERLVVKHGDDDTASIFSLHKTTIGHYSGSGNLMTVEVKNTMHLVDKDFKQITKKGYDDIYQGDEPQFFVVGKKNDIGTMLYGLVNTKEEDVVPYRYSHVKFNTGDSLIIGCTAGLGPNSEDDIYDYTGKKLSSSHRHVELATKKFIIYKIFIPKEYMLVVNLETKEEKTEYAEEAHYYIGNEVLMMNEGHWFIYDVITHKKKPFKQKRKK